MNFLSPHCYFLAHYHFSLVISQWPFNWSSCFNPWTTFYSNRAAWFLIVTSLLIPVPHRPMGSLLSCSKSQAHSFPWPLQGPVWSAPHYATQSLLLSPMLTLAPATLILQFFSYTYLVHSCLGGFESTFLSTWIDLPPESRMLYSLTFFRFLSISNITFHGYVFSLNLEPQIASTPCSTFPALFFFLAVINF